LNGKAVIRELLYDTFLYKHLLRKKYVYMKFCFNRERFGLVHVNFTDPNRTRTPKWSMNWYKDVIETKKLSIDDLVTVNIV